MPLNDTTILVPAAGSGERLGLGPKALLELAGKPLVTWVTQKLLSLTDAVVVAAPPGDVATVADAAAGCVCVAGGETRQESIGLMLPHAGREYVMLADVARPFISRELFISVLEAARERGVGAAFLQPNVPVAEIIDNAICRAIPAKQAGLFQVPHAFTRQGLVRLYEQASRNNWQTQSTLELAICNGEDVAIVEGEQANIKLTTAEDWRMAQYMLEYLE
ncbi:MAG: 2-C-methyl-D-erythritol 4-phosphate cytidylyltransferase [Pseudomonadota bacterium]